MASADTQIVAEAVVLKPQPTVWEALEAKYSAPYYRLMWEVRNNTGFNSTRSADAIAISFYVSREQSLTGFEVKVSRSDWLSELRRPEKADAIAKYCDYFFLVTSTDTIAKLEEIPEPWGWLSLRGSRLKVLKPAQKLKSIPPDRAMLCALVQAAVSSAITDIDKKIAEDVAAKVQEAHSNLSFRANNAENRVDRIQKIMDDFEQASGLSLSGRWYGTMDPKQVGNAVRAILQGEESLARHRDSLDILKERAKAIVESIKQELSGLPKTPE